MRFELYLVQLPRAHAERVLAEMADMPKGLSTGVLTKAVNESFLPTVSVAYSEDKRVINEIEDWLVSLGAVCRVLDRGNVFQKLSTFASERMGAERYLEDDPGQSHEAPKLWFSGGRSNTKATTLGSLALRYLLQALGACTLLLWTRGLALGFQGLIANPPWLGPQLVACACGLFAGYVLVESVSALRAGKLKLPVALVLGVLAGSATLVAVFFVDLDGTSRPGARVIRPPSNPYAGLLTELHRRRLAGEKPDVDQGPHQAAATSTRTALAEVAEDPICIQRVFVRGPECDIDANWFDASACLPAPVTAGLLVEGPVASVSEDFAEHESAGHSTAPPVAALAPKKKTHRAAEVWSVRFELVHLVGLAGVWFACLLMIQLFYERRLRALGKASATEPASTEATGELAETLAQATEREAQLRVELSKLQKELAEAREASEQSRVALASLEEANGTNKAHGARQVTEIMRLNQELDQRTDELAGARAILDRINAAARAESPANDQRAARVPGRPPTAAQGSYSVAGAQEERVTPRRR